MTALLQPAAHPQLTPEVLASCPSPAYLVDLALLQRNLEILDEVQRETGAKILLALKGFAMFAVFPQIRQVLHGVCASGVHEARLGREEFQREVHTFAPAFRESEIHELATLTDHLVFNSFSQWEKWKPLLQEIAPAHLRYGLRINPEHSEGAVPIYDPCAAGSRLGIPRRHFDGHEHLLEGISGLHWHTLCEQNADALERTLAVVERNFGQFFARLDWINFGGGHHISRADYDLPLLKNCIRQVQDRYGLQVYLEPGEAIALNTGVLVATVLDILDLEPLPAAILDTSATAHMPDVLEMPYRPAIEGAGMPGEKAHTYRLGGLTCLAGDVIGDYSFNDQLQPGQRLVFRDMAHYTMVKNTTFNGIPLPSIATWDPETEKLEIIRKFGYAEYKSRLS